MFIDSYGDDYIFLGSKYLEYFSSVTIMHNNNINRT
jgi:hypothetical protein